MMYLDYYINYKFTIKKNYYLYYSSNYYMTIS